MKLIKTAGLVAVTCSIIALGAHRAEAQPPYTPVLTVTANGSLVTIQWTGVAEALGYNLQAGTGPGLANIASVSLPASITSIAVNAPNGTYFLRVRATAGALAGPFSNEASVTVGLPPCTTPPGAPTAAAVVTGPVVTINWGLVADASTYRVEFGLTPGASELVYIVSGATSSKGQYAPYRGTFYSRVIATNACGSTPGNEVPFTITEVNGTGPRTPDPPPGQVLPVPTYGEAVVMAVTAANPGDIERSCGNDTWLFKVVEGLRKFDSRWGLNWKRKIIGDLSHDIVNYHFGPGDDENDTNVYAFDVIQGHCPGPGEPAPRPKWQNITDPNGAGARFTLLPYINAGFPP